MVQLLPENTLQLQVVDKDKVGAGSLAIIFSVLNIIASIYPIYYIILQGRYLKEQIFKNYWAYIDLMGCIGSLYVSVCVFYNCGIYKNIPRTAWHHYRQVAAFVCILIMTKSLYFLKLNDKIAPLIFIVVKIFEDIRYFMLVFFIIQFSFMIAFYLIG